MWIIFIPVQVINNQYTEREREEREREREREAVLSSTANRGNNGKLSPMYACLGECIDNEIVISFSITLPIFVSDVSLGYTLPHGLLKFHMD